MFLVSHCFEDGMVQRISSMPRSFMTLSKVWFLNSVPLSDNMNRGTGVWVSSV